MDGVEVGTEAVEEGKSEGAGSDDEDGKSGSDDDDIGEAVTIGEGCSGGAFSSSVVEVGLKV